MKKAIEIIFGRQRLLGLHVVSPRLWMDKDIICTGCRLISRENFNTKAPWGPEHDCL